MLYRIGWLLIYLPFRLFFPTKVLGRENFLKKGKCVAICNHYTLTDVPNVGSRFYRQFCFIAKKELYDNKIIGFLFRHLGTIKVDREHPDLSSMKAALKCLKDEKMLVLFPEGTRNKSGSNEIQEVKAGAAIFAIKGKAPIVPIVLHHAPKAFRKNYIMVGKPFELEEFYDKKITEEDKEAAGKIIFDKLTELKAELNEYVDNKHKKKKRVKE